MADVKREQAIQDEEEAERKHREHREARKEKPNEEAGDKKRKHQKKEQQDTQHIKEPEVKRRRQQEEEHQHSQDRKAAEAKRLSHQESDEEPGAKRRRHREEQQHMQHRGEAERKKHKKHGKEARGKYKELQDETDRLETAVVEAHVSAAAAADEGSPEREYDRVLDGNDRETEELTAGLRFDHKDQGWFELAKALITLLRHGKAYYQGRTRVLAEEDRWHQKGSLANEGISVHRAARLLGTSEAAIYSIGVGDTYSDGQARFLIIMPQPPVRPKAIIVVTHEVRRSTALGQHKNRRR